MTANGGPISEDDLHGFVDGFLDGERRAQVEAYLQVTPDAAARVQGWQAGRTSMMALQAASPIQPVPARLNVHRLAAARQARRWAPIQVAAGLVLALMVGASAGWFAHQPPAGAGLSALGTEALDAHRVFATAPVQTVEFPAAELPGQLGQLSRFVGHGMIVPDLSASGYRLLGARLVATPHGGGCMFLYDGGPLGHVSILMRSMHDNEVNTAMQAVGEPGVPGYAWARRGLGISLIATGQPDQIHELSDRVRNEVAARI